MGNVISFEQLFSKIEISSLSNIECPHPGYPVIHGKYENKDISLRRYDKESLNILLSPEILDLAKRLYSIPQILDTFEVNDNNEYYTFGASNRIHIGKLIKDYDINDPNIAFQILYNTFELSKYGCSPNLSRMEVIKFNYQVKFYYFLDGLNYYELSTKYFVYFPVLEKTKEDFTLDYSSLSLKPYAGETESLPGLYDPRYIYFQNPPIVYTRNIFISESNKLNPLELSEKATKLYVKRFMNLAANKILYDTSFEKPFFYLSSLNPILEEINKVWQFIENQKNREFFRRIEIFFSKLKNEKDVSEELDYFNSLEGDQKMFIIQIKELREKENDYTHILILSLAFYAGSFSTLAVLASFS